MNIANEKTISGEYSLNGIKYHKEINLNSLSDEEIIHEIENFVKSLEMSLLDNLNLFEARKRIKGNKMVTSL